MYLLVAMVILAILAIPLVVSIVRSNEIVVLDVERGATRVRRGRIPKRLLGDIQDVLRHPKPRRAIVRIVAEGGRPRVRVSGELKQTQLQQLRNVVGRFQLAEIRNAPKQ